MPATNAAIPHVTAQKEGAEPPAQELLEASGFWIEIFEVQVVWVFRWLRDSARCLGEMQALMEKGGEKGRMALGGQKKRKKREVSEHDDF